MSPRGIFLSILSRGLIPSLRSGQALKPEGLKDLIRSTLIKMSCKICGSFNITKIFDAANTHGRHVWNKSAEFGIYRCGECEAIFVGDVAVDNEYFSKYYPRDYYASEAGGGLVNQLLGVFGRMIISFKESGILKYFSLPNNAKLKILDIGCGSGEFLANINSCVFEKYGLEVNPQGIARCRERKIKVFDKELKDAGFSSDSFDVITMWHVLEHLDKPADLLLEARRILKNNGILMIATPNTDSLGFRYGRKNWFHLDSPRHLVLYNRKSLGFLLHKTRFKTVDLKNIFYDFPLDLFWSLRGSMCKYFIYPLYPLFKLISEETLLVAARKYGQV